MSNNSHLANIEPVKRPVWAIVPAAGIGRRMAADRPKQYLPLAGKTVIEHSLHALCSSDLVCGVVVALAADDGYWPELGFHHEKLLGVARGGEERMNSVFNALETLLASPDPTESDWVMVHDAARPCLSQHDIGRLVDDGGQHPNGALLATPLTDSIKQVDTTSLQVRSSIDRSRLWRAQTPQMFPVDKLRDALDNALKNGQICTDESAAMELMNWPPVIIEGDAQNIKITTPADLALANFYIGRSK